jgi:hypothetical protein
MKQEQQWWERAKAEAKANINAHREQIQKKIVELQKEQEEKES